jgi:hypothetical protein
MLILTNCSSSVRKPGQFQFPASTSQHPLFVARHGSAAKGAVNRPPTFWPWGVAYLHEMIVAIITASSVSPDLFFSRPWVSRQPALVP